jgi:hypothetical protein
MKFNPSIEETNHHLQGRRVCQAKKKTSLKQAASNNPPLLLDPGDEADTFLQNVR